ncbi:hypothetical protein FGO68_gene10641 [Halteria grandinella]|uniref:Transmembrane protein n=1 Tax=Halteria grandinella TaxID=5974 RepID=A0A8J8P0M8_HALGN|nr:hypothetical protein FGO68_gene10641 [Halteria grandinella]
MKQMVDQDTQSTRISQIDQETQCNQEEFDSDEEEPKYQTQVSVAYIQQNCNEIQAVKNSKSKEWKVNLRQIKQILEHDFMIVLYNKPLSKRIQLKTYIFEIIQRDHNNFLGILQKNLRIQDMQLIQINTFDDIKFVIQKLSHLKYFDKLKITDQDCKSLEALKEQLKQLVQAEKLPHFLPRHERLQRMNQPVYPLLKLALVIVIAMLYFDQFIFHCREEIIAIINLLLIILVDCIKWLYAGQEQGKIEVQP